MDGTKYLNSVAWRSYAKSVIKLGDWSYMVTVSPIDVNEPGAATAQKEAGFYYKDYIGHTYSITGVTSTTITIHDDFKTGVGPQSGFQSVIYKSVWGGRSPYLAPIYYRHLDKVAVDYSRQLELDILWSNDPNPKQISFGTSSEPKIEGYQGIQLDGTNLSIDYGENPKIRLFQIDDLGNRIERTEKPYYQMSGGFIDVITFGILPDPINCYIEISR